MGYIVYKHTSPSGKVYIGITSRTPNERWGNNGIGYKHCPYFWRAIKKYGWENISHEILYTDLSQDEACKLEISLIASYKATDPKYGYNDLIGGTSGKHGRPYSPAQLKKMSESSKAKWQNYEYRKRMSEVHKGKTLSAEQRRKMSEAHKGQQAWNKGKKMSQEYCEKMSSIQKAIGNQPPSWKDRHHSEESKKRIGEAHKGFNPWAVTPMSEEHKRIVAETVRKRCNKPTYQFTMDGAFVAAHISATEAAKSIGVKSPANITSCARGKLNQAYGYVWKYTKESD